MLPSSSGHMRTAGTTFHQNQNYSGVKCELFWSIYREMPQQSSTPCTVHGAHNRFIFCDITHYTVDNSVVRYYAKRCFLSLFEMLAKNMITVNDKTLDECIQFLENCEGKQAALRVPKCLPLGVEHLLDFTPVHVGTAARNIATPGVSPTCCKWI